MMFDNSVPSLNGIKVILHKITYTKTRNFKWKLKWYQRPFHLFKRYKIITGKRECYITKNGEVIRDMVNNVLYMNPVTWDMIKKSIDSKNLTIPVTRGI